MIHSWWNSFKSFISQYAFTVSIAIVGLLIVQNALMTFMGNMAIKNRNETEQAYRAVHDMVATHTTLINLFDLGLRGLYMMENESFSDPYNIAMGQYESNLDNLRGKLAELNYPHLDSIDHVKEMVGRYAELVTDGMEYMRNGQREEAVRLFASDPGYKLWASTNPIFENIKGFATNLNEEAKADYDRISGYALASQIFTLALGLPVLIIVLIQLDRYEKRILKLFVNLEKSNQQYIYKEKSNTSTKRSFTGKGVIIDKIISNLKKTSSFIQNIAKGNLDVKWEGMDEQARKENAGTIAGELLQMRDQLIAVKEDDEKRKWVTEGVANFSDLVREHKDNFDVLTRRVISYVVEYTNSNQGGLYLLNETEDEPFIELVSSYAYAKHKHIEQRIPVGVGLLGQVFLEGESAQYSDIPHDYINITSGLGEALPRNLIIIPIKMDEKTLGVLELASFEYYESHHIRFLERIALTLASEVSTSKSSALTKELLEASKENEEIMRSQEEEMRQNMEELQATQEEQARQRRELEEKITELERELANNR